MHVSHTDHPHRVVLCPFCKKPLQVKNGFCSNCYHPIKPLFTLKDIRALSIALVILAAIIILLLKL